MNQNIYMKTKRWIAMNLSGKIGALLLLLSAFSKIEAAGQTSNLTYTVPTVTTMSVSGNVSFGTFATPAAGANFAPLSDNTTNYSLTNNAGSSANTKITGQIGAALPTGMSLTAQLAPPTGGTSSGVTTLTTTAVNLVTNIGHVVSNNNVITYSLGADITQAAPANSSSITVTYTLVAA